MEKVPGQLECQLKITDDNLLTNQVYYQNAKSVDPDSLSSVSFTVYSFVICRYILFDIDCNRKEQRYSCS